MKTMKNILTIALLLLMVSGFAQKNQTDINFDSISSTINLDAVVWDNTFAQTGYATAAQFTKLEGIATSAIELIFEYAEYCYNDSIQVEVNVNPDRNTTDKYGFYTLVYYIPIWEKQWQHPTPTFEGFIKWLRENFAPERTGFQINVDGKVFKTDLPAKELKRVLI